MPSYAHTNKFGQLGSIKRQLGNNPKPEITSLTTRMSVVFHVITKGEKKTLDQSCTKHSDYISFL